VSRAGTPVAEPGSDVAAMLAELRETVAEARAMPMSASCILNRAELLDRIAALAEAVPGRITDAEEILAKRATVVAEGRAEAERIVAEATEERERLLAASPAGLEARKWSEELRASVTAETEALRRETDEYVDSKLANFEVVLEKSLDAVRVGLERLAADPADAALRRELRVGADTTLAEYEEVLVKTLGHVRRGRERLAGRHEMEELGEHVRAQDADAAPDLPPLPEIE
jgi:F0F1-type ATP synthase membrane subunit b/b'